MSKIYPSKTYERVFAEQFTDMEAEYDELIASGKRIRARYSVVQGYLILAKSILLHAATKLVDAVFRQVSQL